MKKMRSQCHTGRTENEGDLDGPRTEERHCNCSPHSATTNGVNGAQFTEPRLNARDIEQPTIARFRLLLQTVSASFGQHQEHGFVAPNPHTAVDG